MENAPPSGCGLTDMFKETAISSPYPFKALDTSCAKMLTYSQATGGVFAESQELG